MPAKEEKMKFYDREIDDRKSPKRSKVLVTCSVVFMLLAGVSAIAVALALSLLNINGGGNFTYDATNVYAQVTGALTGAKTGHTFEALNFDSNSTQETVAPDSWQNIDFTFVNNQEIVFTITFENKSTENAMYVQYTDNHTGISNVTFTYKVGTETLTTFTVEKESTKTLTITMRVANLESSVSGAFNFNIKLSNTNF